MTSLSDCAIVTESLSKSLKQRWCSQVEQDYPDYTAEMRQSITQWLLGEDLDRFETLSPAHQKACEQGIQFRYQVLQQRYLQVSPEHMYRNLIQRLGRLAVLRQKIQAWVATSRDRQRRVVDVLQEVIQEMLNSDRHLQQQMAWIAECTENRSLANALLFTSVEEYCMRPIRNQPLIAYRFVNYLRRAQKGGLTNVPAGEWIRQVSDEIASDTDDPISLLDPQAIDSYQDQEYLVEQQAQRLTVQTEFENYLRDQVDPLAAQWLQLYLRGVPQETIAQALEMPIKQVYRLREKVSYHAVRNFAIKQSPELVNNWLGTSLDGHQLGLNEAQWQKLWQEASSIQQQILQMLQQGESVDIIGKQLGLKSSQVMNEWTKLYFAAQALRNQS
ncbi:MAG: HetZ-related protein 2 [Microcoleaceae cyanobacterium]